MTRYFVFVGPAAAERIDQYAQYIAQQSGSAEVARRWVRQVYDAMATLETFPRRFELAEENAHRDYEIRRLILGNYLALYTIDDARGTVSIVGFRHASRLPQVDELPKEPN